MASSDITDVDGSVLEGGGQILRMATGFSALLSKPVRIFNIRAGREKGGLRPQHLTGLRLVNDLTGGKLEGGDVGSTEISFRPQQTKAGEYVADCGTAGSVTLLLQVSLPILALAKHQLRISALLKGGTDVPFSPPFDHTNMVLKHILEKFGIKFALELRRRGYMPKGQGEVLVRAEPTQTITPVELVDRGVLTRFSGRSWVAGTLPKKVAHEMTNSATALLRKHFPDVPVDIETVKEADSVAPMGSASGLLLIAHTDSGCLLSSSRLGEKRILPEKLSEIAANELVETLRQGACVDEHIQDQLIVYMALAAGVSRVRSGPLSMHTKTAIYIAERLSNAKFTISESPAEGGSGDKSESVIIECTGIGFNANGI